MDAAVVGRWVGLQSGAQERRWPWSRQHPPAPVSDAELLQRLATGDLAALDTIAERHAAALLGYLLTIVPDRTLAEEVLQDTLLAAWRSASRFRGQSSVRTWLFSIARRQLRDRRRHHQSVYADLDRLDLTDPSPGPEQQALERASLAELADGIRALRPAHREVLALIFVHGLSYQDAAEVLEVPVGTVKSRLNLARRALQRHRQPATEAR